MGSSIVGHRVGVCEKSPRNRGVPPWRNDLEKTTLRYIMAVGMFASLFAVGLPFLTVALSWKLGGAPDSGIGMASVPCGMLACISFLTVRVLRSYERRIARLEEKLQQTDREDE